MYASHMGRQGAERIFGEWAGAPPGEEGPLRIDPIDPELPGRLDIGVLGQFAKDTKLVWTAHMMELMTFSGTLGEFNKWCGLEDIPKLDRGKGTRRRLQPIVEELERSILERIPAAPDRAVLSKLFLVPKTAEVSRIILDCRALNDLGGKSPFLCFATMRDFFRILSFFEVTHTVTADFRHWFFQLPLPEDIRNLFCLECEGSFYRLKVWAMGFSWSPFVAQAVSMTIAFEGIRRTNKWFAVAPIKMESSPPPFWVVCTKEGDMKDIKRGEIIGFITFWYDNLLIVTGQPDHAAILRREIDGAARACNAIWKESREIAAFTPGVNHVIYLGIEARQEGGQWEWRHAADNRVGWVTTRSEPDSWIKLARILGILTWDWTASGETKGSLAELRKLAQRVGEKKPTTKSEWNHRPPGTAEGVTPDEWRLLDEKLKGICTEQWRPYRGPQTTSFRHYILLASDAMKTTGAGVWLKGGRSNPAVIWKEEFENPETDHINRKETIAAIETVRAAMIRHGARHTLFIVAVDNTTARAVLTAGFAAWDPWLSHQLKELEDLLRSGFGCPED